MYTIGQFSRICRVTAKALRHYEKIGLLAPARVKPVNQYRYYTSEQVALLNQITFMKELGIPLKVIKRMIDRQEGPEEVANLLEGHRKHLLQQVDLCNSRLFKLARWQKTQEVQTMSEVVHYDVTIKMVPEVQVVSKRQVLTNLPQDLPDLMRSSLEQAGDACAGAPMVIYHDEEYNPERVDVEAAWPVSDAARATGKLPACQAVSVVHVGPYDKLEQAYGAAFAYINEHGYRVAGPMRDVYFNDPATTPPEKLVTEILVPVVKA